MMKKILVTGGTVFVSRYVAEYFEKQGHEVYVLNRNSRSQSAGVTLIEADRNALGSFDDYVFLSSSAVYPEYETQPFKEELPLSENKFWGAYGTNKIAADFVLPIMNTVWRFPSKRNYWRKPYH